MLGMILDLTDDALLVWNYSIDLL